MVTDCTRTLINGTLLHKLLTLKKQNMKTKITSFYGLLLVFFLTTTTIQAQSLQWAKSFTGPGSAGNEITLDASGNVFSIGSLNGSGGTDMDPGPAVYNLTATAGSDTYISKLDPAGNFLWAKQIPGASSAEIKLDASGNIYICGSYNGPADLDPGAGTFSITPIGLQDAFLLKLDATGNFIWAKTWGSTGTDVANSIALDATGNIYTTGTFSATVDFDPNAGVTNLISNGNWDCYISKLDASGNLVWTKGFGGTSQETAEGITVDASGVYSTGSFAGTVDLDPGAGTFTATGNGGDVYILKLDLTGNFVWAKTFGAIVLGDFGQAITLDATGNIYSTGRYAGQVDFDPGAGTYTMTTVGAQDIYVLKLDASGNFVWAKTWGSVNTDDSRDIEVDAAGNVYSAGYVAGSCDYDPGTGSYTLAASSNNLMDGWVSKLDASGNLVWAIVYGANGYDFANGVAPDGSGSACITGNFQYLVDFDPSPATFSLSSGGNSNTCVVKIGAALPTGINSNTNSTDLISAYPNPFTDKIVFDLQENKGNEIHLIIYNSIGQVVRSEKTNSNKIIIERENLTNGFYIYQLSSENKVIVSGKIMAD